MQDLSHLQPGQMVAVPDRSGRHWRLLRKPAQKYNLHKITKKTRTQLVAEFIRVRSSDGKLVGEDYTYAIEATPEMVAEYEATKEAIARYNLARDAISTITDAALSSLTTEQMEHLGKAWAEVKAMATAAKG